MLGLNDIAMQYGGFYLFREASLRVGDDDRIAIVGSNGAGKTTLMKIMAGIVAPESGTITRSRTTSVGYLPQDGVRNAGRSLRDEASTAFDEILSLRDRFNTLNREIGKNSSRAEREPGSLEALLDELGEIQHLLEHKEGYQIETRVEQVLSGLGFRERDFDRRTEEFSGGWQMRIELAKLLLREPTVLLLDEPTNHLDIEALEWLENYLQSYRGAVIIVSHDSRFLDNMVRRTVEISNGRLSVHAGNYTEYLDAKETRVRQMEAQYENQQKKIRQTRRFIERFRYKATKARQVQSRIRMLEKMEPIELEELEDSIDFAFPAPEPSGRRVMTLDRICKSYGTIQVFDRLDLTMERGERIAFLGINGAGKSTLARIIAGIEPISEGNRIPGHNVRISYYAQHQAEELDPRKTVLQTLDDVAAGDVRGRLRTLLGCFLFSGDDVFKQVGVLSGGERSRLALAKMLLTPANLLILDEPTNHLDMRSKAVLQEALLSFQGSYILVSHDRDFMEPLVNRVVEFRDGGITCFPGSVEEFLARRHAIPSETALTIRKDPAGEMGEAKRARERKRAEAELRRRRYQKLKPLKEKIDSVEERIEEHESRQSVLERELSDVKTYHDGEHVRKITQEYRETKERLQALYFEWEELHLKIEEIERTNESA